MRVAIVGGGIAGLASAHCVLKAGLTPVVFEASGSVGGSAAPFFHEGVPIDRFPELVQDNDTALIGLIAEHEALGRLAWDGARTSYLLDGELYPLDSPMDLLRFRPLPLHARLRAGIGFFRVTQLQQLGLHLDSVPARDWLVRGVGRRAYETVWDPYLRAKFGEDGGEVPAYWVFERMHREKNGRRDVKGALRGGVGWLAERIRGSVEKRGGEIRLGAPVRAMEANGSGVTLEFDGGSETFGAAISPLRLPELAKLARGRLASLVPDPALSYRSLVSAVVISRKPIQPAYWTAVGDPAFWFHGVCEPTHVAPREWYGGRSVAHLLRWCTATSPDYRARDDEVRARARASLSASFPRFDAGSVESIYVFRAPDVQPVWPLRYLERRPGPRVGDTRVYLASCERAYPRILTSWNTCVTLAREAACALKADR
jgi:protoporphyrinogen oxidase